MAGGCNSVQLASLRRGGPFPACEPLTALYGRLATRNYSRYSERFSTVRLHADWVSQLMPHSVVENKAKTQNRLFHIYLMLLD